MHKHTEHRYTVDSGIEPKNHQAKIGGCGSRKSIGGGGGGDNMWTKPNQRGNLLYILSLKRSVTVKYYMFHYEVTLYGYCIF